MTREEFQSKFRGPLLLFLTEAWACRKCSPSDLGMLMDDHSRSLKAMLDRMYDSLVPKQETKPAPQPLKVAR